MKNPKSNPGGEKISVVVIEVFKNIPARIGSLYNNVSVPDFIFHKQKLYIKRGKLSHERFHLFDTVLSEGER